MTTYLCSPNYDELEERVACPNRLHDWPLPAGYVTAGEVALSRVSQGWRQRRCPDCGLYGWPNPPENMHGTAANPVQVPAGTPMTR